MRDLRTGIAIATLALAASAWGFLSLITFDQTPGLAAPASTVWPSSSRLTRRGSGPQLLLFAHPFCPCTVATIRELSGFVARREVRNTPPAITLVLYRPVGSQWQATSLSSIASALSAHFVWDDGAIEARRFGAITSGYVLLYSASGVLLFRGGVTEARGHEGDNEGLDALVRAYSLRHSRSPALATSRVFGCVLGDT